MPIAYPGNFATKPARAKSGGGFESAIEIPQGLAFSGTVGHGNTLTITDSESRFGTRTNVKPLYVNLGDGKAGSSLGRDIADYFEAGSSYQTTIKVGQVPGGVSFDHDGRGAAIFGNLSFDPVKPLIQYLERYRDYDITVDFAMRAKYVNKTGTINIGDMLTGQTSGATGVVRADDGTRLDFELGVGTIRTGGAIFQFGETMSGPSGSVVNDSPFFTNGTKGLWSTFNLKTNRLYAGPGALGPNNGYLNWQGANTNGGTSALFFVENVTGPDQGLDATASTNPLAWTSEEINFRNSSAEGVDDGFFDVYRGAAAFFGDPRSTITTFDSGSPNKIDTAYLDQVSNGVGGPCNTIIGYQCWDDEYAGVYVGNAPTRSACTKLVRQPQTSWSPSQVSIQLVESQAPLASAFLYFRTGIDSWVSDNGVAL